jgi:DNA-binding MarR family transcriptional regulator/GNAT superfamily N-acetyltransferase
MPLVNDSLVSDIRGVSRDLVRQFGLMNRGVAGTDLSLSAVHAIIETGRTGGISAKDLCDKLLLEKSTISRLVKTLVNKGEIAEVRSSKDLRVKHLRLTRQGKKTLNIIDQYAEGQVSGALEHLNKNARIGVLKGLKDYSSALKFLATGGELENALDSVTIDSGYTPTIIGRTVDMMHGYMNQHFNFGIKFESRIITDMVEFMTRIDSPRNQIWHAKLGNQIVGSISIDGEDLNDGLAHLRWFTVSDEARGSGLGNGLLSKALNFCDQQDYREIHLWTVKGLDAARNLYLRHGFELAEEYKGDQWGSEVIEHKFVRVRPTNPR